MPNGELRFAFCVLNDLMWGAIEALVAHASATCVRNGFGWMRGGVPER